MVDDNPQDGCDQIGDAGPGDDAARRAVQVPVARFEPAVAATGTVASGTPQCPCGVSPRHRMAACIALRAPMRGACSGRP
jgi:hypothetical protein